MSLPKRFNIALQVLIFLLVIGGGTLFAQTMPKPKPDVNSTHESTSSAQTATGAKPDAQYLPTPTGPANVNRSLPTGENGAVLAFSLDGVPVVGKVANAIEGIVGALGDCGVNIFCYMAGGIEVVERKFVDQATGCGNIDEPNGYNSCQQKYLALLNGGTIADVEGPGAIFLLGVVADAGLQLPVPIETHDYVATINPLTPRSAHAQAAQELETSGLVKLWTNIRNAAFAFSAVVLVVIGFMIMFRQRLDPRTTITAMNSLPKVIFAMVMIYFSFALSGFMLDIGRLALQVVYRTIPFSGGALASGLLQVLLLILLGFVGVFLLGSTVAGPVGAVVAVGLIILVLIIAISVLIIILNLIFQMIKRYAQFIVYTIFAPFFFLWGALPGQSSFGWFKSQLANVIAIPAMFLVIRLAAYIGINSFSRLGNSSGINLPSPFSGGGISSTGAAADVFWLILSPLIALGMLYYATKMPAIVDGVLGIKDYGGRAGFGAGVLIGAPLGAASKLGKAAGPVMGVTGAAGTALASSRNPLARFTGLALGGMHDAIRPFGGNTNRFDATGDPSKVYDRSFREKLQHQYNVKNARGDLVKRGMDVAARAKDNFIETHVATKGDPLKTYDENKAIAEMDWNAQTQKILSVPTLAPGRTTVTPSVVNEVLQNHADTLRSQGMPEEQIEQELDKYIKNDWKP